MAYNLGNLGDEFGPIMQQGPGEERGRVLLMAPPKKWSNEDLNFLVYYLNRALNRRFGFKVALGEEFTDTHALENVVSVAPFVLIIFDRPTDDIVAAYKIAQKYDKPVFIIRAFSPAAEEPPGDVEIPFGLLASPLIHNELGGEEKTFIRLVREMIIDRDRLVMEMFFQEGELRLDFFTELLKHLDVHTRRTLLKEFADKYPNDKSFWLASGRERILEGETDEALKDFDEAIRLSPDDPWVFAQRGAASADSGNFDLAMKDVSASIKMRPFNPQAFLIRGNTQYMLENVDAALRSYEVAIEQKPDFLSALNNLAHVYILNGRYADALKVLGRAIQIDREYPFTYLNTANCFREMGRPMEETLEELRKAEQAALGKLVRGDDFEKAVYCLFFVYASTGNVEKAVEYLQKCVDYRVPIKRWHTLDRVWDENINQSKQLREIAESSRF